MCLRLVGKIVRLFTTSCNSDHLPSFHEHIDWSFPSASTTVALFCVRQHLKTGKYCYNNLKRANLRVLPSLYSTLSVIQSMSKLWQLYCVSVSPLFTSHFPVSY